MLWKRKREAHLLLTMSDHGFILIKLNQSLLVGGLHSLWISFISMECFAFYSTSEQSTMNIVLVDSYFQEELFIAIICKFLLMLKVFMIFSTKKEVVINTPIMQIYTTN